MPSRRYTFYQSAVFMGYIFFFVGFYSDFVFHKYLATTMRNLISQDIYSRPNASQFQVSPKNIAWEIPSLMDSCPTGPFTNLEPQNAWIDDFIAIQERLVTDFKSPKLWKGSSGILEGRNYEMFGRLLYYSSLESINASIVWKSKIKN